MNSEKFTLEESKMIINDLISFNKNVIRVFTQWKIFSNDVVAIHSGLQKQITHLQTLILRLNIVVIVLGSVLIFKFILQG